MTPNIASRLGVLALALLALLCIAAGLLTPTQNVAEWMAHPVRVESLGRIPQTTIDGARWLKISLVAGPLVLAALSFALARLVAANSPQRDAAIRPSAPRTTQLTLVLLVGLAIGLRSLRFGDSLWYDEIAGLLGYSVHGPGRIVGNYFSQANHVFSQLTIWCSTVLLGVNEFTIRLPAFLAGIATVPAAWALGREARGDGTGLLMAAAIALMPIAALAACDARGYAFVILFATLATWLLLRARRTACPWTWSAFTVVHALMIWTHLGSVCVAIGHGVVLAHDIARNRDRRGAAAGLVALVGAATLTVMLYSPILPDLIALRGNFTAHAGDEPTITGPEGWHALLALGGSWTWWATLPGAALATLGLVPTLRDARLRRALALAALGGPIAVGLAYFGDSWLYARFLLFLVPATALLIAAGLATLARAGRLPLAVGAAALALACTTDLLRLPPRQPLREAVEHAANLRSQMHDSGPVGTIGLGDQVQLYYAQEAKLAVIDFGDRGKNLERLLPTTQPRLIVMLYPTVVAPEKRAFLQSSGYELAERLDGWIDWGKGAIEIWMRR